MVPDVLTLDDVTDSVHFRVLKQPQLDGARFILVSHIVYYSERYKKFVYVEEGFRSNGANIVVDIASASWWVHDKVCGSKTWADGTQVSALETSMILYDILRQEGCKVRAPVWAFFTYLVQRNKSGYRK